MTYNSFTKSVLEKKDAPSIDSEDKVFFFVYKWNRSAMENMSRSQSFFAEALPRKLPKELDDFSRAKEYFEGSGGKRNE